MYMRCLFTCIFVFCLCSGYAQGWKGAAIEGIRRAVKAAQSKDVRVPKVDDAVVQKIANAVRKEMQFRDSMLSIAKTDTFGIVCKSCSMQEKLKGVRLSHLQVQQYRSCLDYLMSEFTKCKEKAYDDLLKNDIPLQTVRAMYQIVTLGCGREVNQEPPKSIVRRKSLRIIYSSW